jgi:hypothetical protein
LVVGAPELAASRLQDGSTFPVGNDEPTLELVVTQVYPIGDEGSSTAQEERRARLHPGFTQRDDRRVLARVDGQPGQVEFIERGDVSHPIERGPARILRGELERDPTLTVRGERPVRNPFE